MNTIKIVATATALALLAGCATNSGGHGASWEPVVDVRAHQKIAYQSDLADCQSHATRVQSAAESAAAGAVAGAIFGALLGAAAGGNGRFNRSMAGVGALSGAAGAAGAAEGGQRGIISRCLLGRGYSVLN